MTMNETAVVFPLLPSKRAALIHFVQELTTTWREEHDQTHAEAYEETWYLQATPQGDIVTVHLKAQEPHDVFVQIAISEKPFAFWFREQVLELSGVNLGLLPPFDLPQCILHRRRELDILDRDQTELLPKRKQTSTSPTVS